MENNSNIYYSVFSDNTIRQGDILIDLDCTYDKKITFTLAYAVVLTQACDLDQHYKAKSDGPKIDTIIICPAYPADIFYSGQHIDGKSMPNELANKLCIERNTRFPRYHYLKPYENKFPDLVLDFKRIHTIPFEIFNSKFQNMYLASQNDLFRENLSLRFCNFLSRIGLP